MARNIISPENQRFISLIETIKKNENFKKDSQLLQDIKWDKGRTVISEIKGGRSIPKDLMDKMVSKYGISEIYVRKGELPEFTNKNQTEPDVKARQAAEEAIKKIQEMRVKKDPNEILQEAFTSTEVACLYILGVSHQNSLMERRNIEALMQTVDERVRLILLEALAVRRIYLEVTHPKQTSLSVQS